MVAMVKNGVEPEQQQQVANILTAMFGTPDAPFVPQQADLDIDMILRCSGPTHRDAIQGAKGLYREHCVHCHGVSGDGAGPTAAFLNPYPRDYRPGWYKFKSTKRDDPPTTENLMRVLDSGIPGTAMPSFKLMPETDRRALVEYVKYLSLRGQTELRLARWVRDNAGAKKDDSKDKSAAAAPVKIDESPTFLMGQLKLIVEPWQHPIQTAVGDREGDMRFSEIEDTAKRKAARDRSVAIGREMFFHEAAGSFDWKTEGTKSEHIEYLGAACIKCHGPTALGDGQTTDFDDWTKQIWDKATWGSRSQEVTASEVMSLGALPRRNVIPRNLRMGVYRGGRRPLDIYYRIHEGIKGAPMPANELLTADEKVKLKKVRDDADIEFKKKFPDAEISEDDTDDVQEAKLRQKAEFVATKIDPELDKMQGERVWHLVDFVLSLPYEEGGDLGLYGPTTAPQISDVQNGVPTR